MPLHGPVAFTAANGTSLNSWVDPESATWSGSTIFKVQNNRMVVDAATIGQDLISNKTWADGTYCLEMDVIFPASVPGSGAFQEMLIGKVSNGVLGNSVPRFGIRVYNDLRAELRIWTGPAVTDHSYVLNGNVAYAPNTVLRIRCDMIDTTANKQNWRIYCDGTLIATHVDAQTGALTGPGPYALGFRVPGGSGGGTFMAYDNVVAHDTELGPITASLSSRTTTQIQLSATTPGYGLPPYTTRWYESTSYISAGGLGVGTLISGATTSTPTLNPTDSNLRWCYCRVTDANGFDAFSPVVTTKRLDRRLKVVAFGSSTFDGNYNGLGTTPALVVADLARRYGDFSVSLLNYAVGGTTMGAWWTANRTTAIANVTNALADGSNVVAIIGWAVNESNAGRSAADFVTDCAAVIADMKALGVPCVFLGSQCCKPAGGSGQALAYSYHFARASLMDNVWAFVAGARDSVRFELTAQDQSLLVDNIHTGPIVQQLESDWLCEGIARALRLPQTNLGSGFTLIRRL